MLLAPAGVNLKIVPLPWSASNRLPEASKASPVGVLNPEAKVLLAPAASEFEDRAAASIRLKQIARASKARPNGPLSPEAKVS